MTPYFHGDDLISQSRNGESSFYHYDGLGSTRSLTDSQGNLTDSYDYEAFGEVLSQTGTTENSYLFAGEQFDSTLDQYYLRARYYAPSQGRFTQQDTWMGNNHDPITLHKYLYANADPGNMIDPTGNFSMGGMMSAINVMGTLSTIATTTYDVFQFASGEKEFSAREFGTNVLLSFLPTKYVKHLYKKFCGRNSFIEGTLVQTNDGMVPIQDIRIGDFVLSYNEAKGAEEYKEVVHLVTGDSVHKIVIVKLFTGELIEATAKHPFYVEGEWIDADSLSVGEKLFDGEKYVPIKSLELYEKNVKAYNLTVSDNHNYFVGENGVLVHNTNKKTCNIFNANGEIDRGISISSKKLQKKWKHATDFGVEGNFNKTNAEAFRKVIDEHVKRSTSVPIAGSYRGQDVIHYLDSKSALNVIKDLHGNFISGWKLSPAQLDHVLKSGKLGGG